jgi:hypothetical protein
MMPHIFYIYLSYTYLMELKSAIFRILINCFHIIQNSRQASSAVVVNLNNRFPANLRGFQRCKKLISLKSAMSDHLPLGYQPTTPKSLKVNRLLDCLLLGCEFNRPKMAQSVRSIFYTKLKHALRLLPSR